MFLRERSWKVSRVDQLWPRHWMADRWSTWKKVGTSIRWWLIVGSIEKMRRCTCRAWLPSQTRNVVTRQIFRLTADRYRPSLYVMIYWRSTIEFPLPLASVEANPLEYSYSVFFYIDAPPGLVRFQYYNETNISAEELFTRFYDASCSQYAKLMAKTCLAKRRGSMLDPMLYLRPRGSIRLLWLVSFSLFFFFLIMLEFLKFYFIKICGPKIIIYHNRHWSCSVYQFINLIIRIIF